ncbi:transporter substrate-binding domain-containing protein [Oceanobacillus sp. 143]|uniref:Amino acid ABC transporter substrate-binding protein n=1 Tax=Oceanobacillus zhaokaii TaxID=2052660 RepID=A0A345PEG0_9BACI|nr:transporter substrate-binding domain-containing protein [Oceanobacillus zhaokaii]AXI08390.1 amino acid ABC transporter substrate-binding protein [Oceanobacillus zhaokaii]QGS68270.1 transporter substrate-binding domain-containing protein [Oceanobacillus sp. 143]
MKKLSLLLISLIIIAILSACGNASESEEEKGNSNENAAEDNTAAETDERWEKVQEAGELVVGTSGTLIAASYYDDADELTGYDVEVMKEIAKRLDLDISFEIMGIDSMLPAIQSGRIDAAANNIDITDKRKEEFNFSEPYKYSYTVMAVRESDNSGIESLEDLEGKKAGGGATTVYSQIAEKYGAEVVTYGNAPNEAYLSDVSNARTDVVINDYFLTKFGVAAFPDFDLHLHPTLKFHPTEQAVVLPKGADKLTEEINKVLGEMHEDGTLTELAIQFYEEDASKESEEEVEVIEGLEL